MKHRILEDKNNYKKRYSAAIIALFLMIAGIALFATTAAASDDPTPPIQTIELGDPKIPDVYFYGDTWLNMTGSNTPIWINSSDPDSGTDRIEYELWYTDDHPIDKPFWKYAVHIVEDQDWNPSNPFEHDADRDVGEVSVVISFNDSCFHQIHAYCYNYYEYMNSTKIDFVVDADAPSNEEYDYIGPVYKPIPTKRMISHRTIKRINATDTGCVGGVAGTCGIYWRVEQWDGSLIYSKEGYVGDGDSYEFFDEHVYVTGDNDPTEKNVSINVTILQDCEHFIYHKAFDCLDNSDPEVKEPNYVDTKPPVTTKENPEGHGYIEIDERSGYVKPFMPINFTIADEPDEPCKSGIEAFFYRHTWNGTAFPNETYQGPLTAVNGSELAEAYGYTDPNYINYWWFRIEDDEAQVIFEEECKHDLYYWAKDNVWNNEEIHHQTYYVDATPPEIEIIQPEDHGYVPFYGELIDFEDLTHLQYVGTHYPGLTFSANVQCQKKPNYNWQDYPPHSGDCIIADVITGVIRIDFDFEVNMVGGWFATDDVTVELKAYDEFGTLLDSTIVYSGLGNYKYASVSGSGIRYVIFEDAASYWGLDDLEFTFPGGTLTNYGYLKCFTDITLRAEDVGTGPSSGGGGETTQSQEVIEAIMNGTEYLSTHQNGDGSWGSYYYPAHTGLVLIKLQDFAYEQGYSPFDQSYMYYNNVINGWNYLFNNAKTQALSLQDHTSGASGTNDDPDTNGNGIGIYFGLGGNHETYETGISLMALVSSGTPNSVISSSNPVVNGLTFKQVAQDAADWLAFGQTDSGYGEGGWDYNEHNNQGPQSDNSISGYAVLGLTAAKSPVALPGATPFMCTVPQWVKTELNVWIDYIQNDVNGEQMDGGSGYRVDNSWVNELKTGNLLSEMMLYGDNVNTPRFKDAIDYIERHWQDQNRDPGWGYNLGNADYQAMFTLMKGFVTSGTDTIDLSGLGGSSTHDWFSEFVAVLLTQQNNDGSWSGSPWGNSILDTAWSLFILEKIAPKIQIGCASGVEAIFWRYEYEGISYPVEDEQNPFWDVIDGSLLLGLYGYDDPELLGYWWYVTYNDEVEIWFEDECVHKLFYWTKDNVSNNGPIFNHTYLVDDTPPDSELNITGHGYFINDNEEKFIKTGKTFEILAEDDHPCASGVESIFWRYKWYYDGQNYNKYPQEGDTHGFPIITGQELYEKYGYEESWITNYDWYQINDSEVTVWFNEQCKHKLLWFTKDNVSNHSPRTDTIFFVDDTAPYAWLQPPDIGYIYDPIDDKDYIQCGGIIDIYALDDHPCASGLEAIFWRYENETGEFPKDKDTHGEYIITGDQLVAKYGAYYNIPEIQPFTWYQVNGSLAEVWFENNCTHNLTYFAKDNVCNHSEVHNRTFYVDCAPPHSEKEIGEPKWWDEDEELWWVTGDTPFSITAEDTVAPCEVGVDYLDVTIYQSCDNDTTYTQKAHVIIYDNLTGDENLDPGIIVYNFTLDDFSSRECWYKIVWYAVDKLNNVEEKHIQYHIRDDTPPNVLILKPSDGWYRDGSSIPSVVLSRDKNCLLNPCGPGDSCAVGIENGTQGKACLIDIFPEPKVVPLDTTNFLYDNQSNEYIGNLVIPDPSGLPDGVVLLVVGSEDRLGNSWNSMLEIIKAAIIEVLMECFDPCCVIEALHTLLANFIIDQNIVFIGIDNTDPEVEILTPQDGADVGLGPFFMKVNATDVTSGINLGATMEITLENISIGTLIYNDESKCWEGTLAIPPQVKGGPQELTASISDVAGNRGTDTIIVLVSERPGPTTSGTNIIPDPSMISIEGDGEMLTVVATIHSTISTVETAEYFIQDTKPTKAQFGFGTYIAPEVGFGWGNTSVDVNGTFNNEDWGEGIYTLWLHGQDAYNRWGALDEEEFSIVLETNWRPIYCEIENPEDGDEFDVLDDGKYVEVQVDVHYWDDWTYSDMGELIGNVKVWLDDPYGAPDQYYDVEYDRYGNDQFWADIPIYIYSSESDLNIWAKAWDQYGNKEYDDVTFTVFTTIIYDQWMEKEWNELSLPFGGIACNYSVEKVLASIDNGNFNLVFHFDNDADPPWTSWRYQRPWNTLEEMDTGEDYWINITGVPVRYYTDTRAPDVVIVYPDDEEIFWNEWLDDDIWGGAWDIETEVVGVNITLYDQNTSKYWNGTAWVSEYTLLECTYDESGEWWYEGTDDIDYTYISDHNLTLTAYAMDKAGCVGEDQITFMFIDDVDPYIWIDYPDWGTYGCGYPDMIYGQAYDDETIVTDVFIQIQDIELVFGAGDYWNGSAWVEDPFDLPCEYDPVEEEWNYTGPLPQWEHLHYYLVFAWAIDAADNTNDDEIEFDYDCPGGSIFGTVYYYGEGYGNVTIGLFDQPLGPSSVPIDLYFIPTESQGRPVVGSYAFTGLEDGTYWTMGFMDNIFDNNNYDAWEPLGFAVNKSNWPDDIVVAGSPETEKDITLFEPDPSINVTKYVWDYCCGGEWVNETVIEQGDTVRFNISAHNNGTAAPLSMEKIVDWLPSGFEYVPGSAELWIETYVGTYYNDSLEPEEDGNKLIWWFEDLDDIEVYLFPCNWIYLEFEASTSGAECNDDDPYENVAKMKGWYGDDDYKEYVSAFVWIPCSCEPAMKINKTVWDGEVWVKQMGAYYNDIVTFNVSFANDGTCDLSKINITDQMDPELTYEDQMTVDHPDTITSYTFEMSADGQTLWWNFTGYLEPGEHIFIEFDAEVYWDYDDYTYNYAYGKAYCEYTGENLPEVGESIELYYEP